MLLGPASCWVSECCCWVWGSLGAGRARRTLARHAYSEPAPLSHHGRAPTCSACLKRQANEVLLEGRSLPYPSWQGTHLFGVCARQANEVLLEWRP